MEKLEVEGKEYEVIGYTDDGLPIIKSIAVSIQDGFDEHGNPKMNVNITVPPVTIGATSGKVQ